MGKSTVAVNLAAALAASDRNVGLLDIDIHGPKHPHPSEAGGRFFAWPVGEGMLPITYNEKLKVMSIEFVMGDQTNEAVIWRGPMKHAMIRKFISEVDWGELDFLVVDAPPGTGDEPLSICQMAPPRSMAIIVTTPQQVALKDVRKSIRFCRTLEMPIFGIIENMSGFVCLIVGLSTSCSRAVAAKDWREKLAFDSSAAFPLILGWWFLRTRASRSCWNIPCPRHPRRSMR